MSRSNINGIFKNVINFAAKHSPEILTALGISGFLTVTVIAVKKTPKALTDIENELDLENERLLQEADEKGLDSCNQLDKLPVKDVIRVTWKEYLPAAITAGLSIACLIGSNSISLGRNTVLATAYTLSENTLRTYQKKVIDTIGEKKEKAVHDDIVKDKIKQRGKIQNKEIVITEKGGDLCLDLASGRPWRSSMDKIKRGINEANVQLLHDGYVSLNDLYYEIGLDANKLGRNLGWNASDGTIKPRFSTQLAETENGQEPCLTLDFELSPRKDFDY